MTKDGQSRTSARSNSRSVAALLWAVGGMMVLAFLLSFWVTVWATDGVTPFGVLGLGVTIFGVVLAAAIYVTQKQESLQQEGRYENLFNEIRGAANRAAKHAESADSGVRNLSEDLNRAAEQRGRPVPADSDELASRISERLHAAGTQLVLWVDDDPAQIERERAFLRKTGTRTVWVPTTDQALDLLSGNTFGVVVTDMGRPESDRAGYDLLDAMRRRGDATPLLVYSTSREPKHIAEVREHGGQGCTNDPFEIVDLVADQLLLNK
ncbi:response regulator [Curtobacterium sp. NPDC087080]|uniref:response regulator n=1 Tax=Curtobacterium sp. NPDC087080 TaxID=3363965 RepID=UPI003812EA27